MVKKKLIYPNDFRGYGVHAMGLFETHAFLVIHFNKNKTLKEEAERIVYWFTTIK